MRLIDADAFKKVLSEHEMKHDRRRSFDDYDCGAANAYEHASDLLDEMPTIDRPHGKWILDAVAPHSISWFRCSHCGYKYEAYKQSNFCPDCGTPMNEKALEILRKRGEAMDGKGGDEK